MALGGIPSGDQILAQQMKPKGFQFGPTPGGIYGGGNSPVRQPEAVSPSDFGQLAMWVGDGYIAVTDTEYTPEAPLDGQPYVREGGEWVVLGNVVGTVTEAPSTNLTYTRNGFQHTWQPLPYIIPEAPVTGQGYVRVGLNQQWQPAFTQANANALYAPISTVSFPEAPMDGTAYARRGWDHSWRPVATGSGVAEAPPTGNVYVRDGLNEAWDLAFTASQANALYAPISLVGTAIGEAPLDGLTYVRNGALRVWQPAFTLQEAVTLFAPIFTVSFPEAPTDGRSYLRRGADHSWQAQAINPGWITDAPATGDFYVRDGLTQSWVDVQQLDLDGGTYP
jgi:hypothetical protein